MHEPDYKNLIAFLKAMEFNTITRRIAEKAGIDAAQIEADTKLTSRAPARVPSAERRRPAAGATAAVCAASASRAEAAEAEPTAPSLRCRSPPRAPRRARNQKIDRSQIRDACDTLDRLKALDRARA